MVLSKPPFVSQLVWLLSVLDHQFDDPEEGRRPFFATGFDGLVPVGLTQVFVHLTDQPSRHFKAPEGPGPAAEHDHPDQDRSDAEKDGILV